MLPLDSSAKDRRHFAALTILLHWLGTSASKDGASGQFVAPRSDVWSIRAMLQAVNARWGWRSLW
jgi:hypothetical protein